MMMAPLRGPEPGRVLAAALLARLPADAHLIDQVRIPWASATFLGTQHRLLLSCRDAAALHSFAGTIAEADIPLRGHLLADIHAEATGEILSVEALTLVEA